MTTPNTAVTVPVLSDAQKYAIRDKQLRLVVQRANLNNLQNQINQVNQAAQQAQKEFQAELDKTLVDLGTDATKYQFDLENMVLVVVPPKAGDPTPAAEVPVVPVPVPTPAPAA